MGKKVEFPPEYKDFIEGVVKEARGFLEQGQELATMFFLFNTTTGKSKIFGLNVPEPYDDNDRDAIMNMVRQEAVDFGADAVLMVSETWMLPTKHAAKFKEILAKYGSIGKSPYRQDSTMFNFQTRKGTWIGIAKNIPKGIGKKRTFLVVDWKSSDTGLNFSGRLSNIIKQDNS